MTEAAVQTPPRHPVWTKEFEAVRNDDAKLAALARESMPQLIEDADNLDARESRILEMQEQLEAAAARARELEDGMRLVSERMVQMVRERRAANTLERYNATIRRLNGDPESWSVVVEQHGKPRCELATTEENLRHALYAAVSPDFRGEIVHAQLVLMVEPKPEEETT